MRRGELFALRKSDVDLTFGTILVARSNARDSTKGGHADLIPIATPLFPILKHQLEHAPGSLVFPCSR
jgi:integrase